MWPHSKKIKRGRRSSPVSLKTDQKSNRYGTPFLDVRPGSDGRADDAQDPLALVADEGEARQANALVAVAAFLRGELHVLRELRVIVEVQQRHEPAIDLACFF